jgi:hypothetical protein
MTSTNQTESEIKLNTFLSSCSSAPIQRSAEWHGARANSFGGSNMSSFDGINPYQSLLDVVAEKIGLKANEVNKDMTAANWGTTFEPVIQQYIERLRGNKIVGTDIMYRYSPELHYSPDGLMINKDGDIELLEFKCPFSRIPGKSIPAVYVPQLLSGLAMIEVAQKGHFVDALFRRCSIEEWKFNSPVFTANNASDKCPKSRAPLALGYFTIEAPKKPSMSDFKGKIAQYESAIMRYMSLSSLFKKGEVVDLGKCTSSALTMMLSAACAGELTVNVDTMYMRDETPEIQLGPEVAAVMPWKLLNVVELYIDKEPDYINERYERIQSICSKVREMNDPQNAKRKIELYSNFCESLMMIE